MRISNRNIGIVYAASILVCIAGLAAGWGMAAQPEADGIKTGGSPFAGVVADEKGKWGGGANAQYVCNGNECKWTSASVQFTYDTANSAKSALQAKIMADVHADNGKLKGSINFSISFKKEFAGEDTRANAGPSQTGHPAIAIDKEARPTSFVKARWTYVGAYVYGYQFWVENTHLTRTIAFYVEWPNDKEPFKPHTRRVELRPGQSESIAYVRMQGYGKVTRAEFAN